MPARGWGGGWRAGLASSSVCSPEEGGDKYRRRITQTQPGKTCSGLGCSPGPIPPSLASPLGACCQACPPPPGTPQLETSGRPFLPALWGGAETEAQREQGASFKSRSKLEAGKAGVHWH